MDGTIADTLPLCVAAFRMAFQTLGVPPMSDKQILDTFGPSEEGTIAVLTPEHYDEGCRLYQQYYAELHSTICPTPFDGIHELLRMIKSKGIILALVTGKGVNSLETTLSQIGMENYFEAIETGKPSGPDKPSGIKRVLNRLGVSADEATYVGDSASDVISAREVAVSTIGAAWAETTDIVALKAASPFMLCYSVKDLWGYFYSL